MDTNKALPVNSATIQHTTKCNEPSAGSLDPGNDSVTIGECRDSGKTLINPNKEISQNVAEDTSHHGAQLTPATITPGDTLLQCITTSANIASALSASFVPGPIGGSIAALTPEHTRKVAGEMKYYCMRFFKKRPLPIRFLGAYKEITPLEAAKTLIEGSERDRNRMAVKVGDRDHYEIESEIFPMKDEKNFEELNAFYTYEFDKTEHRGLAEFLAGLVKDRYDFVTFRSADGKKLGPYGAYNYLTGGWRDQGIPQGPVKVCHKKIPFYTLTHENTQDISSARKNLQDALVSFKSVPHDESFHHDDEIGKLLKKPVKGTSREERIESFRRLTALRKSRENTISLYKGVASLKRKEDNILNLTGYIERLCSRLRLDDSPANFLHALKYIQRNLGKDEALVNLLLEIHDKVCGFSEEATASMDCIKTPIRGETFDERREALMTLLPQTYYRTSKAFACVKKNLRPGMSLKEGVDEYLYIHSRLNELYKLTEASKVTPQGIEYMRKALSRNPEEKRIFAGIFRCLGGVEGTVKVMDNLRQDESQRPEFKGTTCGERADALIGLFDNLYWRNGLDELDFLLNAAHVVNHSFKELADLEIRILKILKPRYGNTDEARKSLGMMMHIVDKDKDVLKLANQALDETQSIAATGILCAFINKDPAGRDKDDRLGAARILSGIAAERKNEDPSASVISDIKVITENLEPSEEVESAAGRYKALAAAIGPDSARLAREAFIRIKEEKEKGSFYTSSIREVTEEVAGEIRQGKDVEEALQVVMARSLEKAYKEGGLKAAGSVLLGGGKKDPFIENIKIILKEDESGQDMVSIGGLFLPVNDKNKTSPAAPDLPAPATVSAGEIDSYLESQNKPSYEKDEENDLVDIGGVKLRRGKMLNVLQYFSGHG